MKSHSLNRRLTTIILVFGIPAGAILMLFSGILEYHSMMESMSKAVKARLGLARDLVRSRILCDDVLNDIKKDVRLLVGRGQDVYSKREISLYPRCVFWYVLDHKGRVVLVPERYRSFLGLDLGSIFRNGAGAQPHHYISIFTRRSVVGAAYPMERNYTVIVERDLVDIIPTIKYFSKNPIFPHETIFVLSGTGRVIYHPDENMVKTRENLLAEMQDRSEPNDYGFFFYSRLGEKHLVMSMPFAAPVQWKIYYSLPTDIVRDHLTPPLLTHFFMLLITSGIMFILLWFFLHRFFSRPVRRIVAAVERPGPDSEKVLDDNLAEGVRELEHILKAIKARDMAVRRAAEQLSAILNSMDASVYVADMETYELLFINEKIRQWAGDAEGKKCYEVLQSGRDAPCPFCTNSRLVDENGEPSGVVIWENEKIEEGRWFECRDRAIPWTNGKLVRIEISTDITWRKEIEREIFNEKERLTVTLKSIGDAVITTDTDSRIMLMNPVAEKITCWSQKEAAGRPFMEVVRLFHNKTQGPMESPVKRAIETGNIITLDRNCGLIRKDGTKCRVADSAAPIFDRDRNIIGAVVVLRDITEELRTQKELLKIRKLETVGVLAGGIAHDFNNIIAAIMGNIELAQYAVKPTDKAYRQLDNAIKACARAHELSMQLLTFSKGGTPVKKRTFLPELIRESADFVLHGSRIICRYHFAKDLRPAEIDRGQISQVIQNLVLNSIHAMPQGGKLEICCSNCSDVRVLKRFNLPPGHYVKMEIRDWGKGIPEQIIDKIFEPYFSTKHTGSGLGLAIVHSIISKHGGAVRVESEQGQGTTFTILIPACSGHEQAKPVEDTGPRQESTQKAVVLVMDDDDMVRTIASEILKTFGHKVIEASDGKEVVEIYRDRMEKGKHIDLLIMDLTVPGGMGGVEAMEELLKMDPHVKAVVASGYSNDPVMSNYQKYGFKAALLKPYTIKEINEVISRIGKKLR